MKATAWNNGQHHPSGAGYGIKFTAADRDHFFRREWESIQLEVPGEGLRQSHCPPRSGVDAVS